MYDMTDNPCDENLDKIACCFELSPVALTQSHSHPRNKFIIEAEKIMAQSGAKSYGRCVLQRSRDHQNYSWLSGYELFRHSQTCSHPVEVSTEHAERFIKIIRAVDRHQMTFGESGLSEMARAMWQKGAEAGYGAQHIHDVLSDDDFVFTTEDGRSICHPVGFDSKHDGAKLC
jgi:hypothetical protein